METASSAVVRDRGCGFGDPRDLCWAAGSGARRLPVGATRLKGCGSMVVREGGARGFLVATATGRSGSIGSSHRRDMTSVGSRPVR